MTNLGTIAVLEHEYEEARAWFQDAMRLNREVGDAWMVAICDNNLGNATRGLGDYDSARAITRRASAPIATTTTWALAFLVEDIGELAAVCGETERAFELVGAADTLREEIGTPRAPGAEEELDRSWLPPGRTRRGRCRGSARPRSGLGAPGHVRARAGVCGEGVKRRVQVTLNASSLAFAGGTS